MNLHLGLDFATSGARACVLDASGIVAYESRIPYPDPDHQTPLDWREALHYWPCRHAGLKDNSKICAGEIACPSPLV